MGVEVVNAVILAMSIAVDASMFTAPIGIHGAIAVKPAVTVDGFG